MTEKLFYNDSYLKEFTAKIADCKAENEIFQIILDKTAFYPEGGGQAGDTGFLGEIEVLDTREIDGEVVHFTKFPLGIGGEVIGKIDWKRRLDLMQNHSGEHIVSGLINSRFGLENVGFHMGSELTTIDFDGALTLEELREIEVVANEKIRENSICNIKTYGNSELRNVNYRSKKELTGEVRIVEFPESDSCACCGLHVKNTGEIGCIRILSVQNFRSGVRVEMLAGERCYNYFSMVASENRKASSELSVMENGTLSAVLRLKNENLLLKTQIAKLQKSRTEFLANQYINSGDVLVFEPDLSPDGVQRLCSAIIENCNGVCAVFSESEDGSFKYAIGKKDGNLKELVGKLNASLNGRGGGKPHFAQGNVKAKKDEISAFFSFFNENSAQN